MKPPGTALQLPRRPPPEGREVRFPRARRSELRALRELRDRLTREGRAAQALGVARRIAERDPGRESLLKLGLALREAGKLRESLKAFRDALRFESGPRFLLPEIHLHLAHAWLLLGEPKRMGEALRRAQAQRPSPRSEGVFRHVLGNHYFQNRRYHRAIEEYEAAAKSYTRAAARGAVLSNIGLCLERLGRLDEAVLRLKDAIRILRKAGALGSLGLARQFLATIYFNRGQFRRALGMFLHCAAVFHREGNRAREGAALLNSALAASRCKEWPLTSSLSDRASRVAEDAGNWQELLCACAIRAIANGYLGNRAKAESDLAKASSLLCGRRYPNGRLHVLAARLHLARVDGDWSRVVRFALQAERLNGVEGHIGQVAYCRELRAEAEMHLGQARAALFARKAADRLRPRRGADLEVGRIAKAELPILIAGPDGVASRNLARTIHALSSRSEGPCILVPCEQLRFVEAELCGWVRGAWSGADRASAGYARSAEGGTLILDRVDQLCPRDQRVLIRVCEGRIKPVGQAEELRADLRVVATCNTMDSLIPELRHRLSGAVLHDPDFRHEIHARRVIDVALSNRRRITPEAMVMILGSAGDRRDLRSLVERLIQASQRVIGIRQVRRFMTPDPVRHRVRVHTSRHPRRIAAELA